ncbi:hypothetical protein ACFSUD_11665 [Sulfitobacter aestuarii]|uniref:Uncharacterized protein n=1 Tax=Sulfitobacter aestuarii TaxID=2161676 RepID=A0ABW5U331_9RHOB
MSPIQIPAHEHGQIRVFAINRAFQDVSNRLKGGSKDALVEELLGPEVAADHVEIFAVSDLTGVGLPGYLSEGYAVSEAELTRDRGKLTALDGYVLLVFSSAFGGRETMLDPSPDLTLIGTYGEAQPDMSAISLPNEAAQPYTGAPSTTPRSAPRGRAGGGMLVLALIALLILLAWWAIA